MNVAVSATVRLSLVRRCSMCGKRRRLDAGVCYECSESMDWCRVCEGWLDTDLPCRHLRWDRVHGCLCGTGSTHIDYDAHEASTLDVLRALNAVDSTLLQALRGRVARGEYKIYTTGTIFGSDAIVFDCGRWRSFTFRELFGDEESNTVDRFWLGNSWLLSLDAGRTREADALTVEWIDRLRSAA